MTGKDWFADEAFWETFYPVIFSDERFGNAESEVDQVLKLAEFRGRSILDLPCGPGRHSVALARRGFQVTGVDLSSFLLERARQRAESAAVRVEFVQDDMRHFRRPAAYDLVLSLFTSFGFFDEKDDDLKVLQNMFDNLVPGGACVIDVAGKEWLAGHFEETASHKLADGSLMIERREIRENWSRIHNDWILIKDGRSVQFPLDLRIYSAQELKDRLEHTGFSRIRICGDLEGSEYGLDSKRLVSVAWKS